MRERVYLAARYSRREELCGYREQLRAAGYEVPARWLNGEHQAADDDPGEQAQEFAMDDIDDLLLCSIVISFTEEPRSGHSRGGRHVELGIALGMRWWAFTRSDDGTAEEDIRLIVVGPRENVFHWLPEVEHYETWDECLAALAPVGSQS